MTDALGYTQCVIDEKHKLTRADDASRYIYFWTDTFLILLLRTGKAVSVRY